MSRQRQFLHTYSTLLVYGLALVLVLLSLLPSCITAKQWERFRSHATATTFSTLMGGLAIALGGPVGLAVAGTGVVGGVVIDQALEPEPEVHVKTVGYVVQVPPPNPDGTPGKPRVDTYVDSDPNPTPGALKLPDGWRDLPNSLSWSERLWKALQVVWWVVVCVFLLTHAKARAAIWGGIAYLAGKAWSGIQALWELWRKRNANRTP